MGSIDETRFLPQFEPTFSQLYIGVYPCTYLYGKPPDCYYGVDARYGSALKQLYRFRLARYHVCSVVAFLLSAVLTAVSITFGWEITKYKNIVYLCSSVSSIIWSVIMLAMSIRSVVCPYFCNNWQYCGVLLFFVNRLHVPILEYPTNHESVNSPITICESEAKELLRLNFYAFFMSHLTLILFLSCVFSDETEFIRGATVMINFMIFVVNIAIWACLMGHIQNHETPRLLLEEN
jgi:hypothetical protein